MNVCERCGGHSLLLDMELSWFEGVGPTRRVVKCLSCSHVQGSVAPPHEEPPRNEPSVQQGYMARKMSRTLRKKNH